MTWTDKQKELMSILYVGRTGHDTYTCFGAPRDMIEGKTSFREANKVHSYIINHPDEFEIRENHIFRVEGG